MTPREQQLIAQLEQCQQALALAQRENLLLRQKIDALARRIFGIVVRRWIRRNFNCCFRCRNSRQWKIL